MSMYCKTHIGERTDLELVARKVYLEQSDQMGVLTPGLRTELNRVAEELRRRADGDVRAEAD